MIGALYKTKKQLKQSVGQPLKYVETSLFGAEYKSNGTFCVAGNHTTKRDWFAEVTMKDDKIVKVK